MSPLLPNGSIVDYMWPDSAELFGLAIVIGWHLGDCHTIYHIQDTQSNKIYEVSGCYLNRSSIQDLIDDEFC